MPKANWELRPPLATGATAITAPLRLSIAHLLLWTAATGLIVAVFPQDWLQAVARVYPSSSMLAQWQVVEKWSVVIVSPFYGAAIAGVAVAVSRSLQRQRGFPEQPGHWLLVQAGIGVLMLCCFAAATPTLQHISPTALVAARHHFGAAILFLGIALAAVAISAAKAVSSPARWRVFLRLQAILASGPVLAFLIAITYPTRGGVVFLSWLLFFLCALSAAGAATNGLLDLSHRRQLDLLHWAGVIVPPAIVMHPAATWLVLDLLR